MNLHTAKLLIPVRHRQDWIRGRLDYMPKRLYGWGRSRPRRKSE